MNVRTNIHSGLVYSTGEGETLWTISEKFYGTGALWEEIWQDNLDTHPLMEHAPNAVISPPTVLWICPALKGQIA